MKMEQLRMRAKQLNEVSLATQKEREAVEQEMAQMQRAVQPKRARMEEPTEEEDGPPAGVDDWDLADHRREMTRVANRRAVDLLVPERDPNKPRTGKDGFLHHARYGLVGGVG